METIDNCSYLFLASLAEPEEGGLLIVLHQAEPGGQVDEGTLAKEQLPELRDMLHQCSAIEHSPGCMVFTLYWPSYVAYAIENESYAKASSIDEGSGRLFRKFTKSAYLNYLASATFATDEYPGPFHHWGLMCLDHIVNVASTDEPIITITVA